MKQYWSGRELVESWTLQEVLRHGVALLGALAVPLHRLGIVFRYAYAEAVHDIQGTLRRGISLFAGQEKPLHGFGRVRWHGHALLGQGTKLAQGYRVVAPLKRLHPGLKIRC